MGSCPVLEGGFGGSQSSIGSRSSSTSERRSVAIPGREAGEGVLGLKSSSYFVLCVKGLLDAS